MNALTRTLLTGAAASALAAVPAVAGASSVHFAVGKTSGVQFKNGSLHYKTDIHNPKTVNVTATYTFTYTGHESTMYKSPRVLNGTTWFTAVSGVCVTIPGQKAKFQKDSHAKVKQGTFKSHITYSQSGITCSGTLTYYGPNYDLKDKNFRGADTFTGRDFVKKYMGYNLTINQNWTVNVE